jgi:hypothetical protein
MIKRFLVGIWRVVKGMGNIKGVFSLLVVWLVFSGVGLALVGLIFRNGYLIGLGGLIFGFWAAPFTPLIPLCIAVAMLFQRYVLRDKSVGWTQIKKKFKEAFEKDEGVKGQDEQEK